MDFAGTAVPMSDVGFASAASFLGAEPEDLWTVLNVETRGYGFLPDRRPLILFERHIFHRQTAGLYDLTNPGVSSETPGGYIGGADEYERLAEALALDRTAALTSTSWGIGQVMGFNAAVAGFDDVEAMVTAICAREDAQLTAMANFLRSASLDVPLVEHDWATFARGYNGPDYSRNQYDVRLGAAYAALTHGPLPDLAVRRVQLLLTYVGIDPGGVDGIIGRRTRGAIIRFREQHELTSSDEIDDELLAALVEAIGQPSPL